MRKYLYSLIFLIIASACADLDVEPVDRASSNIIFSEASSYRSYAAKIYAAFSLTGQDGPSGSPDITLVSDEGFTSYIRAYWKAQELTTDEAVIAWQDAGIQDLNTHVWSSENQFVRVLYYRLFLIIPLANDFIEVSSEENIAKYDFSETEIVEIRKYRAEARFLRALAYWHALDLFRNVPLSTSVTSQAPEQSSPTEIFNFIKEELIAIEDDMIDARANEYGRADKGALWMLQAKLYLNAEVYGQADHYTECIEALNKVLGAGYQLSNRYQNLFLADNHTSPEMIFTLPSDGERSQSYGSTTFLINGAIGGSMVASDYGASGWEGLRTTSAFVDKFDDISGETDSRAIFYTDGQSLQINDLLVFTDGYAVPKYRNITSTGEPGVDVTFADTDYPMFRLGDAYLMYAEAVLRGGNGGDEGTALNYINDLRERAYGNASGNINASQLTLDFLIDERAREMYWEAHRRVDLIRFDLYTGGEYVWPWKGGAIDGTSIDPFREIFPIPASDLAVNSNLDQNTGY
ncbi:outer membrane protein [Marivirga lumbricoides]|uniref:Outer membrane protein n=1 Tax=Marivirga lumbricoides TaxID=1046115 RepID=A0ABQ1MQM5_9BACT|nr:outer membrane protein [Marivirga lumbricoides]